MGAGHKGWHQRGYLPHFDTPECPQHVVFRTLGSLPTALLRNLPPDAATRRRLVDAALDALLGTRPLEDIQTATIVEEALLHFQGSRYDLLAWCVMPNHVHVIATWREGWSLGSTVRGWKAFSASRINPLLGRSGSFWSRDYFDRVIRGEDGLEKGVAYVEMNPVMAGLVGAAEDWRFSSAWWRANSSPPL